MKKILLKHIACIFALMLLIPGTAFANGVNRISGLNRYETAVEVSMNAFADGTDTVILANGISMIDALTAAPLGSKLNAPVLLVEDKSVPQVVLNEIDRLGARKVVVVGGENSISQKVSSALQNNGKSVTRISGSNRYDTAQKIADKINSKTGQYILASGTNTADALAASSIAMRDGMPILLTNNAESNVPALAKKVIIVGGEASVSKDVWKTIKADKERLAGKNRIETAMAIANYYNKDTETIFVANGVSMIDALSASSLMNKMNAPILLTSGTSNIDLLDNVKTAVIIGGEASVTKQVEKHLQNQLNKEVSGEPKTEQPQIKQPKAEEPVTETAKTKERTKESNEIKTYKTFLEGFESSKTMNDFISKEHGYAQYTDKGNFLGMVNGLVPIYKEMRNGNYYYGWKHNYYQNDKLYLTKEEVRANDVKLQEIADASGMHEKSTQLEKAVALTKYIKNNYRYDQSSDSFPASNIFSLTERGTAKCGGFSLTLARIFNLNGIKAYASRVTVHNEGDHAVVRAHLDGTWRIIEATATVPHHEYSSDQIMDLIMSDGDYTISTNPADKKNKKTIVINPELENYFLNSDLFVKP